MSPRLRPPDRLRRASKKSRNMRARSAASFDDDVLPKAYASQHDRAAIHPEALPGAERRVGTGKEHDRRRDLLGPAEASKRVRGFERLLGGRERLKCEQ